MGGLFNRSPRRGTPDMKCDCPGFMVAHPGCRMCEKCGHLLAFHEVRFKSANFYRHDESAGQWVQWRYLGGGIGEEQCTA